MGTFANPVANLTSVSTQYSVLFAQAPIKKRRVSVLDSQPAIPIRLNGNWNPITRTILPVAAHNILLDGLGDACGFGHMQR